MKYLIKKCYFGTWREKTTTQTKKTMFGTKQVEEIFSYHISKEENNQLIVNFIQAIESKGWELVAATSPENNNSYTFIFKENEDRKKKWFEFEKHDYENLFSMISKHFQAHKMPEKFRKTMEKVQYYKDLK